LTDRHLSCTPNNSSTQTDRQTDRQGNGARERREGAVPDMAGWLPACVDFVNTACLPVCLTDKQGARKEHMDAFVCSLALIAKAEGRVEPPYVSERSLGNE